MSLQIIWYILVGVLLAGYAVLDGFDLGVGVLSPFLGSTDEERATLRSSIGPFWDGNEVWLLTGGGALFAAFPPVYATAFCGFYLAMILVLAGLIFRAVAIEFRSKDPAWGTLLGLGVLRRQPPARTAVRRGGGQHGARGAAGCARRVCGHVPHLLNPYALLIGITGLVMFATQGASWAALRTVGPMQTRAARLRTLGHWLFGLLVVASTAATLSVTPDHVRNNLNDRSDGS